MRPATVALVGDRRPAVLAHRAIERCFELSPTVCPTLLVPVWLPTDSIRPGDEQVLANFAGLWCVPASPYQSMDGALWAIRFARTQGVPFLGTCGGFQHLVIEYARNELGLTDADHAETHPFFIGTLFQPERRALAGSLHPLVTAFFAASMANALGATSAASTR